MTDQGTIGIIKKMGTYSILTVIRASSRISN